MCFRARTPIIRCAHRPMGWDGMGPTWLTKSNVDKGGQNAHVVPQNKCTLRMHSDESGLLPGGGPGRGGASRQPFSSQLSLQFPDSELNPPRGNLKRRPGSDIAYLNQEWMPKKKKLQKNPTTSNYANNRSLTRNLTGAALQPISSLHGRCTTVLANPGDCEKALSCLLWIWHNIFLWQRGGVPRVSF